MNRNTKRIQVNHTPEKYCETCCGMCELEVNKVLKEEYPKLILTGGKTEKTSINLEIVKDYIKMELEMFETDFENKKYGKKAKLLHKHYQRILDLLEKVK